MRLIDTQIPDVKIVEPRVFSDERGFFFESYNLKTVTDLLQLPEYFVQDNHSRSVQGVLRGLHYQLRKPQGKFVRVTSGEAYDVVVDLRKSSKTFGQWVGIHLSEQNKKILWVPPGFAHGFLALSPQTDFLYKTTDYYDPTSEFTILWDDPTLAIKWPYSGKPSLSAKDQKGLLFAEAPVFS